MALKKDFKGVKVHPPGGTPPWKPKSFATENLQKYHTPEMSECVGCKRKAAVCKHGQCATCYCKHYCWLD